MNNVVDLGEDAEPGDEIDYQACEMCGHYPIRYVHFVTHPEHSEELEVGCECVEGMTGDYVSPRRREKALRRKASSRARWLDRKWRTSAKGNPFLRARGFLITVFPDRWNRGQWKFSTASVNENGESGAAEFSKRSFDTPNAAKLAAFEAFWDRFDGKR